MTEQDLQSKETQENNEINTQVIEDNSEDKNTEIRVKKAIEQRDEERKARLELENRLQELESKLNSSTKQELVDDGEYTKEEIQALEKAASYFAKKGFVTKDVLSESERVTKRGQEMKRLQDKYRETDYPDFNPDEVLVYAKQNGFGDNLEAAYKSLHLEAIISVESKKRANTVDSEKPTGSATSQPSVTRGDISNMTDEEFASFRQNFKSSIFKK